MNQQKIPVIGVISKIDDERTASIENQYGAAIELVGGLPLLLPYVTKEETIRQFIEICDGFLFSGGADVDPTRYGEERSLSCGDTQQYRDEVEFKVLALALQSGKPILAICRGMQLLNVALGGTLFQDLPTECGQGLAHKQTHPMHEYTHEVKICENTPLHALIKNSKMQVNSLHHQAIERLGDGLCVMATAEDGIVEAVYMPDKRYLRAYQWHPECLVQTCEDNYNIVQDFLNACMGA